MMTTTHEAYLRVAERVATVVATHMGAVSCLPHGESLLLGGIGASLIVLSCALRRMLTPQPAAHPDAHSASAKAASAAASVEVGAS
jgi:hypothetical protein